MNELRAIIYFDYVKLVENISNEYVIYELSVRFH